MPISICCIPRDGATGCVTSRFSTSAGTGEAPRARKRRNQSHSDGARYRCSSAAGARLPGRKLLHRRRPLLAEDELQLAELGRLEPAPRFEASAKAEELQRRHRLEDVDLRDEHLEDGQHALHRVPRPREVVAASSALQVVELVQNLLEPQLVDLVDDDEQHLVVLGPSDRGCWSASNSSTAR